MNGPPAPDRPQQLVSSLLRRGDSILFSEKFWLLFALICAAGRAYTGRQQLNPDGLNYLDLAQASLAHGPGALINSYWSPGYPALIALLFRVVHPGVAQEFPLVHALNLAVFVLVCWTGRAFIRDVVADEEAPRARTLLVIGWTFLITAAMNGVGLGLVTPDLMVMALVLGSALCFKRARAAGRVTTSAVALGGITGFAYWMKAVMLPLGAALIVLFWIRTALDGRPRRIATLATVAWLVVVSPLILALSVKAGRPSYGEAGRLAWAWNVDHAPFYPGWTDTAYGVPIHQPQLLLAHPRTLEFAAPVGGTYPFSYDPPYWYQGLITRVNPARQFEAFGHGFYEFVRWFVNRPVAWLLIVGLAIAVRLRPGGYKTRIDLWSLATWSLAGLALYAAVLVQSRYVAPFLFLLLLAGCRELLRHADVRWARAATGIVALLLVGQTTRRFVRELRQDAGGVPPYLSIARELERSGVHRGDQIGVVGEVLPADWAHAAGVRVTAQVIDADEAHALDAAGMDAVREKFASIGVRLLVSRDAPSDFAGTGWRYLSLDDGTRFALLDTRP